MRNPVGSGAGGLCVFDDTRHPFHTDTKQTDMTFDDFVSMTRTHMALGAAPYERPTEEKVLRQARWYHEEYLSGSTIDDIFKY